MSLTAQLTEAYKNALKDKREPDKTIINFVLAQVEYKRIELGKEPEDADVIAVIKKEVKATKEAMSFIEKANKPENLEIEKKKLSILESYLPQTMSREQTKEILEKIIKDLGITDSSKERGKIMGEVMKNYKGQIDGSLVNEILNNK